MSASLEPSAVLGRDHSVTDQMSVVPPLAGSLAVVLGTRPEIIKLAGILRRLSPNTRVLNTGQHFDAALSANLTAELDIISPDAALGVGGAPRGSQIGQATRLLDELFRHDRPRAVIVQGDTNSALAGALAANAVGLPLVHVEAGLRSFDRSMPEEHNRVLIDHLADLCLAPTDTNRRNLEAEAIPRERVIVTGNTVVDAVLELLPSAGGRAVLREQFGLDPLGYVLATLHRPENVDDRDTLATLLGELRTLPLPVLLPIHPRTARRVQEFGLGRELRGLRIVEPMPYKSFIGLAADAALLITDSGGVQEEASVLKRPVVVIRRFTERPEVLGTFAQMVEPSQGVGEAATRWLDTLPDVHARLAGLSCPYGDGHASERSANAILGWLDHAVEVPSLRAGRVRSWGDLVGRNTPVKISIFGLGYVGSVCAGLLAGDGHTVVGVDTNQAKVDLVNSAVSPVVEEGVAELIREGRRTRRLRATSSSRDAVEATDMALVCVGTPSRPNGSLDLTYLERVCEQIGSALRTRETFFVVVVRSTVLPGTTREVLAPLLEEASGKRAGEDFGVCVNPEFLREGSAVDDFRRPPKTVIGSLEERGGDLVAAVMAQPGAPIFRTNLEMAEMEKYADNAWHALKVAFANEIGTLSAAIGVDGQKLMQMFCADDKLNISPTYLRPGFAFGGSCLPKDVRALSYRSRSLDLDLPLLNSVLLSNQCQIDRALQLVLDRNSRRVGVLGLSFKPGTDDLRESPMVEVVERLLGKGYDIRIFDANVNLSLLVGSNRDYALDRLPHIADLMVTTVDEVLDHADTVVVGNADEVFRAAVACLRPHQVLVDFARVTDRTTDERGYFGLCW